MEKQRVLDALESLKAELAGAKGVDPQTRETLQRMADDIQSRIESGQPRQGAADEESLSGQLGNVLLEFEAEHPKLTGAINQVAAALANLGI